MKNKEEKNFLSINLSDRSMEIVEEIGQDLVADDRAIIFLNGPMTKSNLACGGRFNILAKSPKNDRISISNSGGLWGRRLAYAGFDGILIKGRSQSPLRIVINGKRQPAKIELVDGSDLWASDNLDINSKLMDLYGKDSSSIYIGRAGEKELLISCLINDGKRASGRDSFGAIFGHKKLKAITVISNNEAGFDIASMKDYLQKSKSSVDNIEILLEIIDSLGGPISDKTFEQRAKIAAKQGIKSSCYPCPITCPRAFAKQTDPDSHKYFWTFKDKDSKNYDKKANVLANFLGVDSISFINYINWLMDHKKASEDLSWDNPESILNFMKELVDNNDQIKKLNGYILDLTNDKLKNKQLIKSNSQKVKENKDLAKLIDLLGLCIFTSKKLSPNDYALLYRAVSGKDLSENVFFQVKWASK
ncbi:MAG: aldehyde ferredoxin oxidoreductase N-terminal domain-containing protein [Tissierellia bacterium]|nr:aldehyde ferredoxin oxidoreductase N-terminal domain-containing protein [Tissierellia bacterium]